MNVDCNWVDSNLETLLFNQLDTSHPASVANHLKSCERCRKQIDDHTKVANLIEAYMSQQLSRAQRPVGQNQAVGRLAVAGVLATAVLGLLLWLPYYGRQTNQQASPRVAELKSNEINPSMSVDKLSEALGPARSKPGIGAPLVNQAMSPNRQIQTSVINSIDAKFQVIDEAGYSYSLNDFQGSVMIVAVFDDTYDSALLFQEVYDAYAALPNLRVLGVLKGVAVKRPTGTTFPLMSNRGSALLDTQVGEFVIIGIDGSPHRRGLLNDRSLLETMSTALSDLGF